VLHPGKSFKQSSGGGPTAMNLPRYSPSRLQQRCAELVTLRNLTGCQRHALISTKKGVLDKLKIKQRQVMTVITNLLTAKMPPDEQ
jgi:hypothetical protein